MDNGNYRTLDESLSRELPQPGASLRIAPLREPVSSRTLSAPSPLEPSASGARESNSVNTTSSAGVGRPANATSLPTVNEFLNAARTDKPESAADSQSNVEQQPPKPILPAFVNPRALERFPFASPFDDDALLGKHKRRRVDLQPDSFSEHLQLPIPQAQKEQRRPPFGPFAILNGLNEPPPNAAILPPIEAGSISQLLTKPSRGDAAVDPGSLGSSSGVPVEGHPVERREARIEELLGASLDENDDDDIPDHDDPEGPTRNIQPTIQERDSYFDKVPTPTPDGDTPLSPKTRGRSRKNLRKWTEEETTDLLRGVVKCGIGNWTAILAQPELKFNKRTASNLKDRFRVCCPWAYRASDPNEATKQLRDRLANDLLKAQSHQSQTPDDAARQMPPPRPSLATTGSQSSFGSSSTSMSSSSGSQRRSISSMSSSMSVSTPDTEHSGITTPQQTPPLPNPFQPTLESLGIPEAHVANKSKRRSRRPFTQAEDEALLKGYAVHGFQWTLIQQDSRLNLGHRRATDLRDRFRTKFPHAYRDGGSVSGNPRPRTPGSSAGSSKSAQGGVFSNQGSPSRLPPATQRRDTHNRHSSTVSQPHQGPVDPALLPPPQGFPEPSASNMPAVSGMLTIPSDENTTAGASPPWEDNTLAPMVWDDLS